MQPSYINLYPREYLPTIGGQQSWAGVATIHPVQFALSSYGVINPNLYNGPFVRGHQEVAATGYYGREFDAADVQWSTPNVKWDFEIIPFEEATKPKAKKNPKGYRARQKKHRQS